MTTQLKVEVYHCPEGIGGGAAEYGAPGWYYDLTRDGLGDYGVGPFHTSLAARYAATVVAEKAEAECEALAAVLP